MKLIDGLTQQVGRLADDVQGSLRRARVEGERRLLQRQHRAALEELGERTYELVRSGALPDDRLGPQVAAVEARLMEIEAKSIELETARADADASPPEEPSPGPAEAAFPMIADSDPPERGAGPGWDAAERFFGPGA